MRNQRWTPDNGSYRIRQIIIKIMEYMHIHIHPWTKWKQFSKNKSTVDWPGKQKYIKNYICQLRTKLKHKLENKTKSQCQVGNKAMKTKLTNMLLLLLLSHFSRVRLCVTPQTSATRLPHPWDSSGKNTGVGCHFLLQCMKVKSESEVAQLCPILSDPMDCSPPGSSVHGIFQARVLEWGAIAFSEQICWVER